MNGRKNDEGLALLLVVLVAFLILAGLTIVGTRVQDSNRASLLAINRNMMDEGLRSAVDTAIALLWADFLEEIGDDSDESTGEFDDSRNFEAYIEFLDDIVADGETASLLGANANTLLAGGIELIELNVTREDDVTGTDLTIVAIVGDANGEQAAEQTVRIGGEPFVGLGFAMVASNVNCVFCHLRVLPLDFGIPTTLSGDSEVERIKIATLENLQLRLRGQFAAHSRLGGTIYTRGNVLRPDRTPVPPIELRSGTVRGYQFQPDSEFLALNSTVDLTEVALTAAEPNGDGELPQFENLYLDYPENREAQNDGRIPDSFPAAFPVSDDDRVIDDVEFAQLAASVDGRIIGGIAHGVPPGEEYTEPTLPTTANALGALGSGVYDGNLILLGTDANPIVFESQTGDPNDMGSIAVNGDVIIGGKVEGLGQLYARGNVYIIGDLTYNDDVSNFGCQDCGPNAVDETDTNGLNNGLMINPGGNILIGDFLTRRALLDHGSSGIHQIDVRAETLEVMTADSSVVDIGYFGEDAVDPGFLPTVGPNIEPETGFASSQIMVFNAQEHQRAQLDADYVPRYYQLRPGAPVLTYVPAPGDAEFTNRYDNALITELDPVSDLANAAVLALTPNEFWVSEEQLRQWWYDDELSRPDTGRPIQVDATLFSNNAIFGLARSKVRHNSNTNGQITIRGGLLAPDLGVLAPSNQPNTPSGIGLRLYFDRRMQQWVRLEDSTRVVIERVIFRKISLLDALQDPT